MSPLKRKAVHFKLHKVRVNTKANKIFPHSPDYPHWAGKLVAHLPVLRQPDPINCRENPNAHVGARSYLTGRKLHFSWHWKKFPLPFPLPFPLRSNGKCWLRALSWFTYSLFVNRTCKIGVLFHVNPSSQWLFFSLVTLISQRTFCFCWILIIM